MAGSSKSSSAVSWQHVWHRGAMSCLLALILLGVVWEIRVAPIHPGGSLLALKVLPLLPVLPGVLRGRAVAFRWLSLLLWFYAAEGITRALTDPNATSRGLGWIELLLALLLFVCVAGFLRAGAARHAGR